MPIDDDAVLLPSTAHFLVGAAGATAPTWTAVKSYITGGFSGTLTDLTDIGHTTLDEVVAFGADGGDSDVKGSLQNKSLRETVTSEAVDYLTVTSLQIKSGEILNLYYGGGTEAAGTFDTPDTPLTQERALLIAIADAGGPAALWVTRSSVRRDDTISMPGDDFSTVPLRFTFLKQSGQPKVRWMSDNFVAAP